MDRVQTSVGSILGWLRSKRPSVGLIPRKYFLYVTWLSWWSAELSSDGSGSNLAGFNPRLALKQAAKFWSHAEETVFHMSLSLDGRALNTSSDGRGSNLGGFNPRLALKQAAKCWSHTEENIFHMTLSLVGRALKSSSYCPGFNLGGFNPRLTLKQAEKSWSYTKENIFLSSVGRALNSS
jgi:hypothetical protein